MIDIGIDFLAILAPFWKPSLDHIADFSSKPGVGDPELALFFVALAFCCASFAVLTPSWLHFGSIWALSGLDLGGFGLTLKRFLVSIFYPAFPVMGLLVKGHYPITPLMAHRVTDTHTHPHPHQPWGGVSETDLRLL